MDITIKCEAKEIAALVLELQERLTTEVKGTSSEANGSFNEITDPNVPEWKKYLLV